VPGLGGKCVPPGPTRVNLGHPSGITAAPTHPDHPDACPQTANPTRIGIWAAGWGPTGSDKVIEGSGLTILRICVSKDAAAAGSF
jgi:hypothetical protein